MARQWLAGRRKPLILHGSGRLWQPRLTCGKGGLSQAMSTRRPEAIGRPAASLTGGQPQRGAPALDQDARVADGTGGSRAAARRGGGRSTDASSGLTGKRHPSSPRSRRQRRCTRRYATPPHRPARPSLDLVGPLAAFSRGIGRIPSRRPSPQGRAPEFRRDWNTARSATTPPKPMITVRQGSTAGAGTRDGCRQYGGPELRRCPWYATWDPTDDGGTLS